MLGGKEHTGWRDLVWVAVCALLSSAWCLGAARHLSATFDEPGYLRLGIERWRTGSFTPLKRCGVMPLPLDVQTFPVAVAEYWRGRPIDPAAEIGQWLPVTRAANLLFWCGLLVQAWRGATRLAGLWAGRCAVAWLALEPNLLAHASLATTDIAMAACMLAALNSFVDGRQSGWLGRIIIPAVGYSLALLAKASSAFFIPMSLVVIEASLLWESSHGLKTRLIRSIVDLAMILGLGFAMTSLYCGPGAGSVNQSLVAVVSHWPASLGGGLVTRAAAHCPIYSQAWDAILYQVGHNVKGHGGVFLLGEWHQGRSLWYYFPVALAIKLPLPLLLMPAAVLLIRPRLLRSWPVAVVGACLLASLTCRVQIGIRYLLPAVALGIMGLAAALARLSQVVPQRRVAWSAIVTGVTLALASAWSWPDGLRHTNLAWGGPDRGYWMLADSNYDWGQGLIELADWRRRQQCDQMDVAYFGADPRIHGLGFHPVFLPSHEWDATGNRWLAVSTTALFGHEHSTTPAARRLRQSTPAARTRTFLIFDQSVLQSHGSE